MSETLHIYTRVSSIAQQEEGTSLETQRELGIKKAEKFGFEHRIWNEGGASSNYEDFENRPVLLDLLSEIKKGQVKHLWVYDNDRLSRNEFMAQTIRATLKKHSVTLYTDSGKFDLNNPHDNFIKTILDGVAQLDNTQRAERTRMGKLKRVQQGYWMGGPAPFGYKIQNKKLIRDDFESGWVEKIYQWYAIGKSVEWIKSELDKNGVYPRRQKNLWSLGSIQKILQNTHPSGHYSYRDSKTGEAVKVKCPAIVSKNLWNQCQEKRRHILDRKGQKNRTKKFYLLRDLMYCGHCGGRMAGRIKESKNEQLYYCPHRERAWKIKSPDKHEKYARDKGCGLKRSLNIKKTDDLIMKEIGSNVFLQKIMMETYNHFSGQGRVNENDHTEIEGLKLKKRKLEKELDHATNVFSEIKTKELMGIDNKQAFEKTINRVSENIQKIECKIEQVDIKIREVNQSLNMDSNVIKINFESIVKEIQLIQKKTEMHEFMTSLIEKITVYYDAEKAEHRLVIKMKKNIIGHEHILIVPQKKTKGFRVGYLNHLRLLGKTPLRENRVTVE